MVSFFWYCVFFGTVLLNRLFDCVVAFASGSTLSYLGFSFNATDLPSEDYYDYIVVGGGTAGCPLAATLSQNFRVMLLERGGIP